MAGRKKRERFEREVLPHLDSLYGMSLRLTHDRGDAEDLLQDTLVKAYRFFDRFQSGSNAKAWLFKILTNTFYNRCRKRKNIRNLEAEAEAGGHYDRFLSSASTSGKDALDVLLEQIAARQLQAAIDELPEEYRVAVLLCDLCEFSYREIAEIIERPVGTVMSRLYRGRRLLQKRLYDYALEQGYISAEAPAGAQADAATASADEAAPTDLATFRRRRGGG